MIEKISNDDKKPVDHNPLIELNSYLNISVVFTIFGYASSRHCNIFCFFAIHNKECLIRFFFASFPKSFSASKKGHISHYIS